MMTNFCDCCFSLSSFIVDRACCKWTGRSTVKVNIENERFTVVCSCYRWNVEFGNFRSSFDRLSNQIESNQVKSSCLTSIMRGVVPHSPEPEAHVLCVRAFQVELEFRSAGFWGEGKTWLCQRIVLKCMPPVQHSATYQIMQPIKSLFSCVVITIAVILA